MIENGATTIWERWDGYVKGRGFQDAGMNSFNHCAFGAVGEWMYRVILGINPDDDHPATSTSSCTRFPAAGSRGPRIVRFDPRQDRVELAHGRSAFTEDVDHSREHDGHGLRAGEESRAVTESGVPASRSTGVRFVRMEGDAAVFTVQSGRYSFAGSLRERHGIPCGTQVMDEYFSMINSSLLRAAFVAGLCSSASFAQSPPASRLFLPSSAGHATIGTASDSVQGLWNASMETPGGTSTFQLDLKVRGDTLSGTVIRARGNVPLSGVVKDNVVAFSYTIDYNGNPFTLTVHATVSGDTMTGTVDIGGNGDEPFSAKRAAATAPPA